MGLLEIQRRGMIAIGVGASSRAERHEFALTIAEICRQANGCDAIATFESAVFAACVEEAAAQAGVIFRRLTLADLRSRNSECSTQSKRSLALLGVASVAEAAALAAAGAGSHLIVPRRIIGRITVAAAKSADAKPSCE
jgi:cobalt-precorrin 5A hydrolase